MVIQTLPFIYFWKSRLLWFWSVFLDLTIHLSQGSYDKPDSCWCAYVIGKDIFNNTLTGLLWGLLHILSGTKAILIHT